MESTNQPDKFGLVVQCRANMDGLLMNELQTFAIKIHERLSMDQLKAFMFIGLNGIKKNMESAQLLAIKSSMHEIVQKSKKKKNANKKQDENPIAEADVDSQSMTRLIPDQVISSNICPFLLMPEICELAQVDRSLCIIAHTPSSLSNLCIRHDPYRFVSTFHDGDGTLYPIDGNFSKSFLGGLHRFRYVEKLSLCRMYMLCNLCFPKAKHLTLAGRDGNFPCRQLPSMPSLTSIVFEGSSHTDDLLDFLKHYKAASTTATESADIHKEKPYFQDPIYNVKSIAIVNCGFCDLYQDFDDDEEEDIVQFERYQSICKFLLPSQPNQLKVLKLEASLFETTDSQQYCDEWNAQFVDLDRIKSALSGLEGFVYSQYYTEFEPHEDNQFYQLSKKLLSHKNFFPHLRSIHVHSPTLLNSLLCGTLNSYSNFTATPINELCVTIPIHASQEFLSKLKTICTKLTKCCLVFHVKETKSPSDFATVKLCADILRRAKKLKLFQLVLIVDDGSEDGDPTLCSQLNKNVVQFSNALMTELKAISTLMFSALHAQRPLLFKFHVKSMHRTLHPKCKRELKGFPETIKNLILTYLLTFCSGVIQCKLSQNHWHENYYQDDLSTEMRALELLLDADVTSADIDNLSHLGNKSESCNTEKDYAYYAISARSRRTDSADCNLEYDKRWNTDCEYCCNTPWL